jgi:hypothetical protein
MLQSNPSSWSTNKQGTYIGVGGKGIKNLNRPFLSAFRIVQ